jgi:hypothetical protein
MKATMSWQDPDVEDRPDTSGIHEWLIDLPAAPRAGDLIRLHETDDLPEGTLSLELAVAEVIWNPTSDGRADLELDMVDMPRRREYDDGRYVAFDAAGGRLWV